MADDTDQESKTEEPTEKRIADAVEKGNTPFAREVTLLGSLAAILAALLLMGAHSVYQVAASLSEVLGAVGGLRLDDREGAANLMISLIIEISVAVVPIMALVAAGSVLAALMQNTPSAAAERITPRMTRISPVSGWTRLFGKLGLIEFLKSVIKLASVGMVIWLTLKNDLPQIVSVLSIDPRLLPATLQDLSSGVLVPLLSLALIFSIVDMVWTRLRWRRELRMTQHDVKQEMREAEGDPLLKARIRSIARQRSSRRMLENLPTASMVITNPTHYAIALRYVRSEGGAPVVVAKGVDHLALRIREIAGEHDVPLVENRPLAHALYEQVEVDDEIPPEFYRAVAEIIHYLNSRGRLQYRPPSG